MTLLLALVAPIAASAGNRTRIYCLEGNNANLYTTDAVQTGENSRGSIPMIFEITILNFYIS